MALFSRPKPRGRLAKLKGAATIVSSPAGASSGRTQLERWQTRAFAYYDMLGECWAPAQFYSRGLSKIRFFPARRDESDRLVEADDLPEATQALAEIAHVAKAYGRLMFLIGEGLLCYSLAPDAAPDELPRWEFLSPSEVWKETSGIKRRVGGKEIEYVDISDEPGEPQPGEMRMWRMWRPHPQNSNLADSPVRGVLDLLEQLWWLTMGERADIQSRLADNGILVVPEEISFGPDTAEDQATDDDPESDALTEKLGDAMVTAIQEPGEPSASVPILLRGPAEFLGPDKLYVLHTHDASASVFVSQRERQLIDRIAMSLDMPVEEVVGMSTANHWTAWKIDEQKWQYLEPVADEFANDLRRAILTPLLESLGIDPDEVEVGYDNSALVRDPDRGKTALSLHKEGLLSAEATLEANGFTLDDEMPEDERQEWLAIMMRSAELLGAEDEEETDEEPPPEENIDEEPDEEQAAMRAFVSEFAVRRARGVAGSHLRSLRRSCEECFSGMEGVPNDRLLTTLGSDGVKRLDVDVLRLKAAMVSAYATTAGELGWGVRDPEAVAAWFSDPFRPDAGGSLGAALAWGNGRRS